MNNLTAAAAQAQKQPDRLFVGTRITGLSYCDTQQEQDGDYKLVAFLPFSTLKLEVRDPRSPLLGDVVRHAAGIRARRGEKYQTSTCGQYVILGEV